MADVQKVGTDPEDQGSLGITDPAVIRRFTDDPDFPFLVSFPRTGSHWLRMLMELYFDKPSLVRAFYTAAPSDFTCYHSHDEDLKLERRNVIYLYRNPVPTIYSQLSYYREDPDDLIRITYWSSLYGRHLRKWLLTEKFTAKKTVLTYEALKSDLPVAFAALCGHFNLPLDAAKLEAANARVSKESLKKKTGHDNQVVNLSQSYEAARKCFQERHSRFVMEAVLAEDEKLAGLFPSTAA